MATIKHLTSKNSNYAAAESYLTFQHNEYTGLPILDEKGRPKLRDSYLLDTLECGGIVRVFRGHADCSRRLLTLEKIAEVIFYSQFGAAGLLLDGCHTVHQPFLRLSAESS